MIDRLVGLKRGVNVFVVQDDARCLEVGAAGVPVGLVKAADSGEAVIESAEGGT